ncbi:nucleoporin protein Ndc1-Nup [Amylostereum chailletii]|nr:nucleoporin protein Ndc1-Nup [Amylostereum chailletii]
MSFSSSTRQDAPVRAATQTYEPLAKAVLRHRLLADIFPASALYTWATSTFWIHWNMRKSEELAMLRRLSIPFLPSTLFVTALLWTLGVVPVIVLRKSRITATPSPSPSPSHMLKTAFLKTHTLYALITYAFASLCTTTIHILLSRTLTTNDGLNIFVKSRKHPYYVNGRFLYFVLSQIALAFAFHARDVLLDRYAVKWRQASPLDYYPSSRMSTFPQTPQFATASRYLHRAVRVAVASIAFTTAVLIGYTVTFGLARTFVLPIFLRIPVVSLFLRPFSGHFLRGSWTISLLPRNLSLIWRVLLLSLTTCSGWEFAEILFDDKVQLTISVASQTADPGLTLVSGAGSTDLYFKYLAYHELCQLAQDDSALAGTRRTAIFGDQKYNPSIWSTFVRESLLTLGNDYQLLLRRGKPAPPPAPAPATPAKPKGPEPPATPFIRKPIFKSASQSPVRSVLESFASDGTVTQAFETSVESTAAHLPEIFKAIESPVASVQRKVAAEAALVSKEAKAVASAPSKGASSAIRSLSAQLPRGLVNVAVECREWWSRERFSKAAEGALPNRELDALIVEVLSHLVCASLTEDRYGIVQRDIPRILEAMLSFMTALEDYQAELLKQAPPTTDDPSASQAERVVNVRLREELTRAGDVISLVGDALKLGIIRIVQTFRDRLAAFRFPPRTARKLQGFVDYN